MQIGLRKFQKQFNFYEYNVYSMCQQIAHPIVQLRLFPDIDKPAILTCCEGFVLEPG